MSNSFLSNWPQAGLTPLTPPSLVTLTTFTNSKMNSEFAPLLKDLVFKTETLRDVRFTPDSFSNSQYGLRATGIVPLLTAHKDGELKEQLEELVACVESNPILKQNAGGSVSQCLKKHGVKIIKARASNKTGPADILECDSAEETNLHDVLRVAWSVEEVKVSGLLY